MAASTVANAAQKALPIAVAVGDGIGPEIMNATLKIFQAARVPFNYHFVQMGKTIYQQGHSTGMTKEAQETVERTGILFKGPMETPKGKGVKSINVTARKVWNTFANKRVFESIPGVETVFSKAGIPINLTLVRENIEDTYGGIEHMQTHDVAQCRRLITRPGCLQVHRYTFEIAKQKNASRVTCGHKANIMKITDGLFLETFYEVAQNYPGIKADDIIVDDLAMKLVMSPQAFDVVVLPNLQGDIISDLCAGLVGGLGLAPSANIGENISIFEAIHGTAPDIAGKLLANPTALILSGLMMLRHVGLNEKADLIHLALLETLKSGVRTRDLAKPGHTFSSTDEFASAIITNLPAEASVVPSEVAWTHKPPVRPQENEVRTTKRVTPEGVVGFDVFLDSDLSPVKLAEKIKTVLNEDLELIMLSNRGTQVWPTGSNFTTCVNHYRARLQSKGLKPRETADLLAQAQKLTGVVRVCSLEMLLRIGDKDGFSLAQGQ
eukprot:Colp12_sorted_trinity150504_noHs@4917